MIEISISSELADEHPRFIAASAQRGHRVEVFDSGEAQEPAFGAQTERDECLLARSARSAPADGR
jgi:hypothetical protein